MKITRRNYFTKSNRYLSNSKTGDFKKSKAYFKKKHLDHKVEKKESPVLLMGSMVDTYLTEGPAKFRANYVPVARRNLKEPPGGYTEVTQAVYDEAKAIASAVARTSAFRELKTYKSQQVLFHDIDDFVQFPGICGQLDWLKVDAKNKAASIRDLKTAKTNDPQKYYWHAMSYRYHAQMAMYGWLVEENFGIPFENIDFGHIVVEKDPDGIHNVRTFMFDNTFIKSCREAIKKRVYEIDAETKWIDDPVTWKDAFIIKEKGIYDPRTKSKNGVDSVDTGAWTEAH